MRSLGWRPNRDAGLDSDQNSPSKPIGKAADRTRTLGLARGAGGRVEDALLAPNVAAHVAASGGGGAGWAVGAYDLAKFVLNAARCGNSTSATAILRARSLDVLRPMSAPRAICG